jgi:tetratricopeptide (TPR) repeat protein
VTSPKLEIVAEPGKTSFTTRRVVDAPRSLVFDAFTRCEHLKQWMGPQNLTMASCQTDLRVGGRYRFVFRTPDGSDVGFSGATSAYAARGDALMVLGRFEEAIVNYDHVLESDPTAVDTWCNRGAALQQIGQVAALRALGARGGLRGE